MKKPARLSLAALLAQLAITPAAADPGFPRGWGGGSQQRQNQDYEFGAGPVEGAHGAQAAYIRAKPGAASNDFFTMTQCVATDNYAEKRMRLSGHLKTVNASAGQMWMRVDQGRFMLSFDNMDNHRLTGTVDWKREEIVLNVPEGSDRICFGFLLAGGRGEVWADDLKLEPVGMNVPLTTPYKRPTDGYSWGGMSRFDGR